MAAGRQQVDYSDIDYDALTFKIDNVTITYDPTKPDGIGIAAGSGLAVMLSADDTVALTSDGAAVMGKLLKVEKDGFATIQYDGFAQLPQGDTGVCTRGNQIVGATKTALRGFVRDALAATAAELVKAAGVVVNVADTTNVWVLLG